MKQARRTLCLCSVIRRKRVNSFAATLDGVDTLVFAGGIGENALSIRARICAGLDFSGIELSRNAEQPNR
jgi:acetate kinase